MTITSEVLNTLKAPFPEDHIFVRVLEINEEGTRALLVKYLRHVDVATRLDSVDLDWASTIINTGYKNTHQGELVFTHMRLTILGVSRDNVGEGYDPKSSASDALKRCAMSFGVGRYLCNSEESWVDYNETTDRGREWTLKDFDRGLGLDSAPPPPPSTVKPKVSPVKPKATPVKPKIPPVKPKILPDTKRELVAEVRRCQRLLKTSNVDLESWARESAGVSADKMNVPQLQQFVGEFHIELRKAKIPV